MSNPDDTSVQVALRIRPQSASEKIDMCHICTSVTPSHPQVILGKDKAFTYDHVFDLDSVQPSIYDAVARPLIEGCFEGYNATILAYGQTGSGKTYTMGTSFDLGVPEHCIGIIPRAARHLFDGIQARRDKASENGKPLPEIKVTAQFLELYNEDIVDLLDIEMKGKKNIRVHENHDGQIYLTGVASKPVNSANDCMTLLEEGAISRTTASTNMNATSSRSHAIFTLFVKHHRLVPNEDEEEAEEFEVMNAKFNFVDLAGSERLKRTGATGDRAKEGISINQGLLSLGNVISALGDKMKRGSHVPYRDSKLTRLLQDSLGGNSRTLMIACVSPSDRDFMETLNTLKYANRARNIKNKVMVNQDKASKQIAFLRQEIQQLTLELTEYKSGKRVTDGSGEHMTDTFHELEMLRNENETLRMRLKALQNNIDSQNIQLTELKVTSALANVTGDDKVAIEDMVKKYEQEIQKLSNKLLESEAMSSAAVRRAQTVSRMAMSPGTHNPEQDAEFLSVLNAAKQELRKEKKLKKKLKKKSEKILDDVDEEEKEGSEPSKSPDNVKENGHVGDDDGENNDMTEDIDDEDDDELGDIEGVEDDDEEELQSNTDSDTDDELNQSLKDEEALQDNINDLDTDITIKQKLIDELEHSQQRLTALKHQYEQKLGLLHNKIKETEDERDKVLKNIGSVDVAAKEKSDEVRKRYEKKLTTMQKELSKLQNAKREHQRLLRTKEQNEQQLKLLRNEMNDMKKMKVKLMRQMRDEVARNKKMENKLNQQMEGILKENRKKEVQLKRMKDEKKQRDLVLKRKQEELNAMRKQAKPISGNVSSRRGQVKPNNLQLQFQSTNSSSNQNTLNETFVVDNAKESARQAVSTPPHKRMIPGPIRNNVRSPAVSKKAKQKWELIERKITELTIRMKNVAQMENDMDRWLTDREKISKQLETVRKRKTALESSVSNQDENLSRELQNQLEGLEAHLEYIQENITESQGTIMGLEEEGEGINTIEVIQGCSLTETKYLVEHFYGKSLETAQELANKDAAYKEIQIKLEAMEQHCEVQQQLLQHACNLEYGMGYMNIEDEAQGFQESEINNLPPARKARRKTALPEELLHPKDRKSIQKTPEPPVIESANEDPENTTTDNSSKNNNNKNGSAATEEDENPKVKLQETFQIDEKTMQKLMDLEKSLRDRKAMPPPPAPVNKSVDETSRPRSGSFSSESDSVSNLSLPGSFQRNTRLVKSARNYGKSNSSNNLRTSGSLKKSSSVKASPLLERKTSGEATSSGQILPAKSSPGSKPDHLTCMYTASGHSNAILSLDVKDHLMITGSKDRTAKVWDLNTSEEILSLAQHKRDVSVVKFVPNSQLAVTVYQSTIKLWDLKQGTVVKTLSSSLLSLGDSSVADIDINKEGSVLFAAFGNFVKMIDLRSYSTIGKLTGHTGSVTCLLVADTGHNHDNVITGSKDHSIKIFEVVDEVSGSQMPRQNLEPPHYDGVESLAMKHDFIFSGSRDNTIKKWNYKNHALEHHVTSAHKDWVTALNFVPGHDVLASGDRRGIIRLWDIQSCKMIGEVPAHGKAINAIKCNDNLMFTASSDRLVRIWQPSKTLETQISAAQGS